MGYDAFVKCNCYRDGKISSRPPFEKHIKEDEEGIWLDLEWKTHQSEHAEFDSWMRKGPCPHKDMEIASERLANISGMGAFRIVISELGEHRFPILFHHLPKSNGGSLPVEFTPKMRKELQSLKKEPSSEKRIVLLEKSTNQRVQSVNASYESPFAFDGQSNRVYSISHKGLKIVRSKKFFGLESNKEIFLSSHFTQNKISDERYFLTDLISGKSCLSGINLYPDKEANDSSFEFEIKLMTASISEEYDYIITPLLKLAEASLQSGNPIIWT
jgi:hypothetical protein